MKKDRKFYFGCLLGEILACALIGGENLKILVGVILLIWLNNLKHVMEDK